MSTIKSNRVPVQVEKSTFEKLQEYSKLTGVGIAHAVNEAVSTWLETVGAVRMEVLTGRADSKTLLKKITTRIDVAPGITNGDTGWCAEPHCKGACNKAHR